MKYSDGLVWGRKSQVWVQGRYIYHFPDSLGRVRVRIKHRFMNEFWNKKDSLIILFHIAKLVVDRKVPFLNFDHFQYVFAWLN